MIYGILPFKGIKPLTQAASRGRPRLLSEASESWACFPFWVSTLELYPLSTQTPGPIGDSPLSISLLFPNCYLSFRKRVVTWQYCLGENVHCGVEPLPRLSFPFWVRIVKHCGITFTVGSLSSFSLFPLWKPGWFDTPIFSRGSAPCISRRIGHDQGL